MWPMWTKQKVYSKLQMIQGQIVRVAALSVAKMAKNLYTKNLKYKSD